MRGIDRGIDANAVTRCCDWCGELLPRTAWIHRAFCNRDCRSAFNARSYDYPFNAEWLPDTFDDLRLLVFGGYSSDDLFGE